MTPTSFDPSSLLAWVTAASLLATVALVVLAVAVPLKRGFFLTLAAAAFAGIVAAYVLGHVLAWLPIISLIVAIGGMGYLAWILWTRLQKAIQSQNLLVGGEKNRLGQGSDEWQRTKERIIEIQGSAQKDLDRLAHSKAGFIK